LRLLSLWGARWLHENESPIFRHDAYGLGDQPTTKGSPTSLDRYLDAPGRAQRVHGYARGSRVDLWPLSIFCKERTQVAEEGQEDRDAIQRERLNHKGELEQRKSIQAIQWTNGSKK
jgi:hypothetical protein